MTNVIQFPGTVKRVGHDDQPASQTERSLTTNTAPAGLFAVLRRSQFSDGAIARIARAAGVHGLLHQARGSGQY